MEWMVGSKLATCSIMGKVVGHRMEAMRGPVLDGGFRAGHLQHFGECSWPQNGSNERSSTGACALSAQSLAGPTQHRQPLGAGQPSSSSWTA